MTVQTLDAFQVIADPKSQANAHDAIKRQYDH